MLPTRWIARLAVPALLALASVAAHAETYRGTAVTLEVPEGFAGPTTETPAPQAEVVAFVKRPSPEEYGALLQITTHVFDTPPAAVADDGDRAAITYLREFLAGVERRRSAFSVSQPRVLEIDGQRVARANWTGERAGVAMRGTMYATVLGHRLVVLHAQDVADPARRNVEDAMGAIERARFDAG